MAPSMLGHPAPETPRVGAVESFRPEGELPGTVAADATFSNNNRQLRT